MTTCTACGSDVTGKKFCQQCGTPVQTISTPSQSVGQGQNAPTTCPACHQVVAAENAFCVNCGQNLRAATASAPPAATMVFCNTCGRQNAAGIRFCGGCGSPLSPAPAQTSYTPPPSDPYSQPHYAQTTPSQYQQAPYSQYNQQPQPYGQPQILQNPQYGQYGQQGQQPQPNSYGQPQYQQNGYAPQPMMGQQPMVLRCPVCQAMAPMGTTNCVSCRTSLAGVLPTPAAVQPGQPGAMGGMGGFLQGSGGQMAMGALGGAAAVIGGEMLLHGIENRHEHRGGGDEGLLGGLGEIANDIGLF